MNPTKSLTRKARKVFKKHPYYMALLAFSTPKFHRNPYCGTEDSIYG
jgi:hypothetical protein